ncbi:hypothetical protein DKM44_14735 [Deinococcus irradiatisoli]|uniref:Uncharacterized protein n=1 Tax=Deinococcus irradiatisoli TaxID=2202254 RepID=A0A2Z3JSW6_9DEIO|nr:hypothetical protein DKM44_14735 [Deinococcus irradiatisoli]
MPNPFIAAHLSLNMSLSFRKTFCEGRETLRWYLVQRRSHLGIWTRSKGQLSTRSHTEFATALLLTLGVRFSGDEVDLLTLLVLALLKKTL